MTIKSQIEQLIRRAIDEAQRSGQLPAAQVAEVPIERPQNPQHGDFASSVALKLARPMRMSPMAIAQKLVPLIPVDGTLEKVWAANPGFINFALSRRWLASQVDAVRQAGASYGDVAIGAGTRVQVEFVSANPTGPLHVGHARGAVIGSALASILKAAGYDVQREYYINDAGNQMERFNQTLYARYQQQFGRNVEVPEDGYRGEYMVELARQIMDEHGDRFLGLPEEQAVRELGEVGLQKMLECIRADLDMLRVHFDSWFSERSLYSGGQYERAMQVLRDKGYLAERDGALWFTSTALGEDKDNVVVRSTGSPTYFASDIAYHYNKFIERGFDHVINIWGADHQGHVPRMKAMVSALGVPQDRLTLIISQLVTFKRHGEVARLSKRAGEIVTVRELVEEVGPDACRFFFLSRSPESQMEFDLELAKEQSQENPVYYVQYAHARIASILRLARERGIDYSGGNLALLTDDAELALIRKMLELPELVELMARNLEPHHLPHYAVELATAFHWFYQQCRVVSSLPEDAEITRARLKLVDAARTVLARCLDLMSMTAPEQM